MNNLIILIKYFFIYICYFCCCHILIDWFKAGKGPDPAKVVLDKEIDAYFDKKPAEVTATTSS